MNIFARELVLILGEHDKTLGSLYNLHTRDYRILPNKVTRLIRSLDEDMTATLNEKELAMLQEWVPLDPEGKELRRLRAALVAEAVRHLAGGRMSSDAASQLGELTLQLFLGQEPEQVLRLREEVIESLRGTGSTFESERGAIHGITGTDHPAPEAFANSVEQALEAAIETYEQGALWLEMARDTTERRARVGHLAQAQALFARARELVTDAPTIAQQTPEQAEWLELIDAAQRDAGLLA